MTPKTRNIIGWILTGILALLFVSSGVGKLMGGEPGMADAVGGQTNMTIIAIIELGMIVLFLIPRTVMIGFLLMVAYMGGTIAFHLTKNEPVINQIVIQAIIWITGAIRLPELLYRLQGRNPSHL